MASNSHLLSNENVLLFPRTGAAGASAVIARLDFESIKAIISTPGITVEIRDMVPVPVVTAYLGYMDILETIRHIELNLRVENRKIALLIHESNPIEDHRLDYFIHNTLDVYRYASREGDMRRILQQIARKNYELLIGGPSAVDMAKSMNIKAVQLIYNDQALFDALERAREILALMRKEQRQIERLRAVIDVIPDGIIETDNNGVIGMYNQKTLEMLGLSPEEIQGRKVHEILGDASWQKVYQHGSLQEDRLITYKKNKYFSTRQPIFEGGKTIGSVGTLQEATKIQNMENKYRSLQTRGLVAVHTFQDIVGSSPVMREIIRRTRTYTRSDTTILLEGETGTGKEIFAQSIHNESPRQHGPFVAINCAALTESLLESELMGYDEGAFTGARKKGKMGLFEQAHKGTIFLDEINQLPLHLQAKLLRVIQEKSVMHLGGDSVIPVDVRIIAGTNENLRELIAARKFRRDLYYRINVLGIVLPPLRERLEDIPELLRSFASKFTIDAETVNTYVEGMTRLVAGYQWPGNIRELQNFVERYVILKGDVGRLDEHFFRDFQEDAPAAAQPGDGEGNYLKVRIDTLENMENALIKGVVKRCAGNKSKAALIMNIGRSTIYQKARSLAAE